MRAAHNNDKESSSVQGYRPRPTREALQKLVLKNTSRPFDDDAALEHLRAIDSELVEADSRLIDTLLS
jgi:gentisate 1,2-dioxygenase